MRQAHQIFNTPHPKFRYVPTIDEALESAKSFGFSIILKPIFGVSSQFIHKINNEKDKN